LSDLAGVRAAIVFMEAATIISPGRDFTLVLLGFSAMLEHVFGIKPSELVDSARKFEPWELRNIVRHVTDAIDGDGGAATDEEQFGRRRWHMSRTIDRLLKIDALLSGDDAEVWERAITAEMDRDRVAEDARSLAQMRADAATNVMRHALDPAPVPTVAVALDPRSDPVRLRHQPGTDGRRLRGPRRGPRDKDREPGAVGGARRPRPGLRHPRLRCAARTVRSPSPAPPG
jgi:Domain of unknown function (DUF222)